MIATKEECNIQRKAIGHRKFESHDRTDSTVVDCVNRWFDDATRNSEYVDCFGHLESGQARNWPFSF